MNKDTNALLKSIKEDLKECKQIIAQGKVTVTQGLEILSKL